MRVVTPDASGMSCWLGIAWCSSGCCSRGAPDQNRSLIISPALSDAAQKNGGDSHHPIWRPLGTTSSISLRLSLLDVEGRTFFGAPFLKHLRHPSHDKFNNIAVLSSYVPISNTTLTYTSRTCFLQIVLCKEPYFLCTTQLPWSHPQILTSSSRSRSLPLKLLFKN